MAITLLVFGGSYFYASTSHESFQSTLSIEPGLLHSLSKTLLAGSTITVNFQEESGNPLWVLIMNSAQWASVENGRYVGSLYEVRDVAAGTFAYTTQTGDTYYIVFDHGSGLQNTNETVTVAYDYAIPNPTRQGLGILSAALGGLMALIALRTWRKTRGQSV